MILKKNNGFVGVDITIAIIAILIFSTLIVSLMYNNALENAKLKKEAMAIIYLTETFENVAMADYIEVTEENKANFIPSDLVEKNYNMDITIESDLNLSSNKDENIIKNVIVTISYELGNKEYKISMERTKIKE